MLRRLAVLALASASPALTFCLAPADAAPVSPAERSKPRFEKSPLPLASTKMYDLSVADIEGDGDYDLFSANHKFRGSLLASDGAGGFHSSLDASGLSAASNIPGFDDLYGEPEIATKGLYIWVDRQGQTHILTRGLGTHPALPMDRVGGQIRFLGREDVSVVKGAGAQVSVSRDTSTTPPTAVLSFDAGADSHVVVRARFMDLPFTTKIERGFPRSRLLLGPRLSHPPDNQFTIDLGDRHGVAWADFNGDGNRDAYIANGGQRTAIRRFSKLAGDELYFGDGEGHFKEGIAETGALKGKCRGRHAIPVDYDADGDLDIFVGCEGRFPLLLMQRAPGKFEPRSELAEQRVRGHLSRWLDIDGSGPPELVAVDGGRLSVYRYLRRSGRFARRQRFSLRTEGKKAETIATADIDGDRDIDVFIGSPGGNSVLVNRRGRLDRVRAKELGLPRRKTIAGSFVDYDNDGRLDFHSIPSGLFRGLPGGNFERTGAVRGDTGLRWASSQWLDNDSDGDRDLVSTLAKKNGWVKTRMFENSTKGGNWLEVDLVGPAANREAIGARVSVGKGRSRQVSWVGQNEGSRYSTGHYRSYFGLGREKVARNVTVIWPDGKRTKRRAIGANQRVQLIYDR